MSINLDWMTAHYHSTSTVIYSLVLTTFATHPASKGLNFFLLHLLRGDYNISIRTNIGILLLIDVFYLILCISGLSIYCCTVIAILLSQSSPLEELNTNPRL
eukprot:253446_1